jgi:beta-lactamase superfamily II metal-dependent hydrolase
LIVLLPLLLGIRTTLASIPSNQLTITFIDVGQGEAILVQNSSGFEVLVDGGRKSAGESVLTYLRQNGIDQLEVVIATHADSDHIGGLIRVIEAEDILVESVYFNGYPGDTNTWIEFSDAVTAEGLSLIPAQYPQDFSWGGISFEVLNPISGLVDPEQNEVSIVLAVEFSQINALLTADIDANVESMLLIRSVDLESEILKVPHHGSKLSSSSMFLQEVAPDEAIISVGSNQYSHPAPEVISRLKNIGAHLWRTDQMGTIQMISDGSQYRMLPRLVYLPISFSILLTP